MAAASHTICTIPPETLEALKKFRLARNAANDALILKVDTKKLEVIVEQDYHNTSLEDLQEELPESVPRYIAYNYKCEHKDGRVSPSWR
eukprot:m51a1_g12810 putative glia maturation factor gamma (89) ;mRNA; f:2690-3375